MGASVGGYEPEVRREEPLEVLFVGILPPQPGGGAISCGQLLTELAGRGHRVRALAPIPPEELRAGDEFAARHPEIVLTRFAVPYYAIEPTLLPPAEFRELEHRQITAALPRMIAARRPDVILIGRGSFVLDVADVARDYNIPCVLRSAGATSLGIVDGIFAPEMTHRLLDQYRKLDLIISPARHLAERLREAGLSQVQTIPNAVDTTRFFPQRKDPQLLDQLRIGRDEDVVVHASNLKPFKRPLDLIAAAERILHVHRGVAFVIVGDGLLRNAMEAAVAERGIADRFRFVGWIDYAHVPEYLALGDIVAMPSEGEGLSRVYLETQASGRLLLASDIPAAREVVVDSETGLLFRKGDPEDLAARLRWAVEHPRQRAEIGRRAREYVVTFHSLDRAVSAYAAALCGVVYRHTSGAVGVS